MPTYFVLRNCWFNGKGFKGGTTVNVPKGAKVPRHFVRDGEEPPAEALDEKEPAVNLKQGDLAKAAAKNPGKGAKAAAEPPAEAAASE